MTFCFTYIHAKGNDCAGQWLPKDTKDGWAAIYRTIWDPNKLGSCTKLHIPYSLLALLCHYLCTTYWNCPLQAMCTNEPCVLAWTDVSIACTTQLCCSTGWSTYTIRKTALLKKIQVKVMGGLHSLKAGRDRHVAKLSQPRWLTQSWHRPPKYKFGPGTDTDRVCQGALVAGGLGGF